MFQPSGGKPVPISRAVWNWSGHAHPNGAAYPPYYGCHLVSPVSTTGADWLDHPTWSYTVHPENLPWQTNQGAWFFPE